MKLISCHIENFGRLTDYDYRFEEGLNTICLPNGAGKTTLAAFLRIMFYGFSGDGKRNDLENERLFYRPWSGGVYGGSVTFRADDTCCTVYRTFGGRKKEDSFRLLNAETGLASDAYSSDLGEELFGIDGASFARTVFCGQLDLETGVTAAIRAKIGNLADEQDDMRAYDDAQTQLRRLADRLSPDRANGLIRQHRESLSAMTAQLGAVPALRADEERLASEYMQLRDSLNDPTPSAENKAEKRDRTLAALEHREQQLMREGRDLRRQYNALSDSLKERALSRSRRLAKQQNYRRVFIGSLVTAFLLILLAAAHILPAAALPLLVIPCAAGLAAGRGLMQEDDHYDDHDLSEGIDTPMDMETYAEIRASRAQCLQQMRALSARIESLRRQRAQLAVQNTDSGSVHTARQSRMQEVRAQLDDVRAQLRELDDLALEADHLRAQIEEETRRREICLRTSQYLTDALESMTARYMPPFLRSFRKYYGILAGEAAMPVQADAGLGVSVVEAGLPRDPAQMSTGTRDLISLCRRLAMADAMYPVQKPFLVMDDPFVNLDDERIKGGLQLLRSASRDYQILYLTCHESRCP